MVLKTDQQKLLELTVNFYSNVLYKIYNQIHN